ncbi:protein shisa-6-like [Heptranchias perlo]|uniref:protein shisa-6-like n=1 Tax=Heptranchias perlo TaxID=212740 RepID=UPI003559FFAA
MGGAQGAQNASRAAELKGAGRTAASVGDTCRGYYDVMGQYDPPFNCSTDTYLYCCGSCHYRFCCEFLSFKLDQGSCNNYDSPDWANTPLTSSTVANREGYDPDKDRTNSTVYIICAVLIITLAVGITVKVAFKKAAQQPRDINVSRALVDILRHQAVSMPQPERNNLTAADSTATQDDPSSHPAKTQYTPVKTAKTNPGKLNARVNRKMNFNTDRSRINNLNLQTLCSRQNALLTSRSYHNLSHLPPSYESTMKSELNRYSSLKRLAAKDIDDLYCKRRQLAEITARGTLPLRAMKTNHEHTYRDQTLNPRRVMSQDRLLTDNLPPPPPPPPRPPHPGYATVSRDRLLSPDRLGGRGGGPPFAPQRPLSKKALSQTNVGVTPWLDRHQMVKMNSHPTASPRSGVPGGPAGGVWGEAGITDRRLAFAAKRHSTVEQLHFIPGHSNQQLRTGSRTEVTV